MMGFDGASVSPQIRSLIENYHLGSVLLSTKNLKCIMSLVLYLISFSFFPFFPIYPFLVSKQNKLISGQPRKKLRV